MANRFCKASSVPEIAERICHGERSVAISICYQEITAHPLDASNDTEMFTLLVLTAILGGPLSLQ